MLPLPSKMVIIQHRRLNRAQDHLRNPERHWNAHCQQIRPPTFIQISVQQVRDPCLAHLVIGHKTLATANRILPLQKVITFPQCQVRGRKFAPLPNLVLKLVLSTLLPEVQVTLFLSLRSLCDEVVMTEEPAPQQHRITMQARQAYRRPVPSRGILAAPCQHLMR